MSRLLPPDHPQRRAMTLELHARPFPPIVAPAQAIQLAFTPPEGGARDAAADLAHLEALIDRFGAARPAKEASHYYGQVGRTRLKWERHTEFVSYTLFEDGPADSPFDLPVERLAPADWLAAAPGALLSAIRVHITPVEGPEEAERAIHESLGRHFVPESTFAAHVGEGQATVIGDFRIHEDGFSRFAALAWPRTGERRLGRIVQRLIEIENYRMLSMAALPLAREIMARLNALETELAMVIAEIAEGRRDDERALGELTRLSAAIEALQARSAYRFAAANAYAALVEQRVAVLREARAADRQLLSEFMQRRFAPAMRTTEATQRRLAELAGRAARGASLLSARVNVAVEKQNKDLLVSMNRRAEAQLRLQHAVEGLSVVAISYYAVGLAGYVAKPLAAGLGLKAETAMALLALPVALGVWLLLRRLRARIEGGRR